MSLILPMFTIVLLTFIVMLLTGRARFRAVKNGLDPRYFKTYTVGNPPEDVLTTGRHFSNLFEVPVLFYVACLAAMQLDLHSIWYVGLAWGFVFMRILHAYIHLTSNHVLKRMRVFSASVVIIMMMWVMLLINCL